jgi:hypothetical protein
MRPRESAVSCKQAERLAGNHRVETEALSCIGDHEEALHENQKDVKPRPQVMTWRLAILALSPDRIGWGISWAASLHRAFAISTLAPKALKQRLAKEAPATEVLYGIR